MKEKIISVDAETDGLYGPVFAIGAVSYDGRNKADEYSARLKDLSVVEDEWVIDNVLRDVHLIARTFNTRQELFDDFWAWYVSQGTEKIVIGHVVHPVETGLFRELVQGTERRGPYPGIHDVATLLWLRGEDPASVDSYNAKYGLPVPCVRLKKHYGRSGRNAHDPVYDAHAALTAWLHLCETIGVVPSETEVRAAEEHKRASNALSRNPRNPSCGPGC